MAAAYQVVSILEGVPVLAGVLLQKLEVIVHNIQRAGREPSLRIGNRLLCSAGNSSPFGAAGMEHTTVESKPSRHCPALLGTLGNRDALYTP